MIIYGIYKVPNEPTPKEAIKFWEKHLKGKKFYNRDINKNVIVTQKGIEKCIYGSQNKLSKLRMYLIFIIEYLIQEAVFKKEEKDKKNRTNTTIIILEATVIIESRPHIITIRLRKNINGIIYYYHSEIRTQEKKGE